MKRIIALICAVVFIALSFTSCGKKNIYVDKNGNSHTLVMKKGEPVQDEFGNLIEKYKNDEGKNVTGSIMFPEVMVFNKGELQNAYIKFNVPNGWSFDESLNSFRIKKDDCKHDGKCEIFVEAQDSKTLDEEYRRKLAAQEVINLVSGEEVVKDIEESETEIFGLKTKVFKSIQRNNETYYYYVFFYVRATIGFSFVMNNDCVDDKFDPEAFIKENVSLKTLPTK